MYNLQGKMAIVTGAGGKRGLGKAIARRLAEEGADIAIVDKYDVSPHDKDEKDQWDGIRSVAHDIESIGRRSLAILCDITSSAEVESMFGKVVSKFGKIDILVNNAGMHTYADIQHITDETWGRHLAVNLTGTFYCCRAAARQMLLQKHGGRIINIASQLGKSGAGNGQLAYCASKFGVIGLTQCLALELAPHKILVNAICPTLLDTDLHSDAFQIQAENAGTSSREIRQNLNDSFVTRIPVGRLGTTEDIASMAAFLASGEASFITGQSINVNGGFFTAL